MPYRGYKRFESRECRRIIQTLRVGDSAIDVGAHIGVVSRWMLDQVSDLGRVVAIEPSPAAQSHLRRLAASRGLTVVSAAAGRAASVGRLRLGGLLGTDSRIDRVGETVVRIVSVDDVCDEASLTSLALLKIDVQGAELDVLMGSQRVLREYRPRVVVEVDTLALRRHGTSVDEILRFFGDFNYQPVEVSRSGLATTLSDEVLVGLIETSRYLDVTFVPVEQVTR